MTDKVHDAVIVGSGAAGAFAAQVLTARGLDVVMLEAGRTLGPADFDPARKVGAKRGLNILERAEATLMGQPVQARAVFFRKWQAHLFINDRRNPYTTPKDAPFLWIRARQRGGRMHSYGRVLMRWSDEEFLAHSRRGVGVDWPVTYADLAPFYDEVERCLAIRGNADGIPEMPDGQYAGPSPLTAAEAMFKARAEAAVPGLRIAGWRFALPDPDRMQRPLREALASGRLTLHSDAVARQILTDQGSGRATGVDYIDTVTGARRTVRARSVVLCASPVESVRLMALSASSRHPGGIGNGHDQLGRYFQDQLPLVAQGDFPPVPGGAPMPAVSPDPFYDPSGGIFIARRAGHDFAFQGVIGHETLPEDQPGRMAFFGYGEMRPSATNRITVSATRKDAWEIPVPHICCRIGPEDVATLRAQSESLRATVAAAGGRLEFLGTPLGLQEWGPGAYPKERALNRFLFRHMFRRTMVMGAAIHESGGARMGDAPDRSVLNPWAQCWEVPNLIVTDAAGFAGGGVTGTTLTVMALTVRACRHLAGELAADRL